MRHSNLVLAFALCLLATAREAEARDTPHPPKGRTPEVIQYDKPAQYAKIPESAGDAKRIRELAAPLRGKSLADTLRNIHVFIVSRVPNTPEVGWRAEHRTFDQLILGFDHTGCACHGLLFANLARACGIPTVYIKSMRHNWIREFVAGHKTRSFSGHVFLEIYDQGKWKLLDAQGMRLWDAYDPTDSELPGGLYAYEKGSDHYAMVHSTRRDDYIRELKQRWTGFDPSTLREKKVSGTPLLPTAFAVTLADEWKVLGQRISSLRSFDLGYWKKTIPQVTGNLFIVTSIGGRAEIPADEIEEWLPVSAKQLHADFVAGKSLVRERLREDGTLVVLVSAPGTAGLMRLLWATDFEAIRARHTAGKK